MGQMPDSFKPIDMPDSFVPISLDEPTTAKDPILDNPLYQKMMKPLLPSAIDESQPQTETYIGGNTPIIKSIWPGGIRVPHIKDIYEELIRPMSAPIGLATLGIEGLLSRTGKTPAEAPRELSVPESPVIPKRMLELPPAPSEVVNPPKFIAGPAGVAENKPYTMDIGPINPALSSKTSGTILPQEVGELTKIPPELAATKGLELGRPVTHTRTPAEATLESLVPDRYKSRLQLTPEPSKPNEFNIGDSTAPYQLPSAVKKSSKIFTDAPASIDEVNAEPSTPKTIDETVLPKPGQAKPMKDINGFTANFTSPDITLASRPVTKPIADVIVKAQDQKSQWVATTQRELADLSNGLNKNQRITLGKLIDGQVIDGANPELQQRANQAKVILDSIHDMFPEGATKSGGDVGYFENYFTHIQQQPTDIKSAVSRIIDHHFGPILPAGELPLDEGTGVGDLYHKGLGKPSSPYVEERSNLAHQIEYDVHKVFPAYVESAAKVIFDRPAVEFAKSQLAKIPDGTNLKELATAYIQNYANYDSLPGLSRSWNDWTGRMARITSRSLLGFNTGLQTLHAARVVANMYPELGEKYSTIGLMKVARNPITAWTESAKLGLLQQQIRPMKFQTPMEKFDSISNFFSVVDSLDKSIGYHGYKQMMLDKGMPVEQASLEALKFTKRVSQTIDPARQMMAFNPPSEGNAIASAAIKLGGQFKQTPAKIVEQYINIAKDAKNDPKTAARLLTGVGLALAANEGLRTFHISPTHMIPTSIYGAFGDTVSRVAQKLYKGDWEGALTETALWATPGGKSIQRQIQQGPSALNP